MIATPRRTPSPPARRFDVRDLPEYREAVQKVGLCLKAAREASIKRRLAMLARKARLAQLACGARQTRRDTKTP